MTTKRTTKSVAAKKAPAPLKSKNVNAAIAKAKAADKLTTTKPVVKKAGRSASVSGAKKPVTVVIPQPRQAKCLTKKVPVPVDKDGGNGEAIETAAKNAATVLATMGSGTKEKPDTSVANAPIDPKLEAASARIMHALKMSSLGDKLTVAAKRAGEVFTRIGPERARELWHVIHYFEQWFILIEREICTGVDANNEKAFNQWIQESLAHEIKDGEYVKLTFADGTRGIALGTIISPVVLREVQHGFLAQMKHHNPSFAETMKQQPEFQHTLVLFVSIPKELFSLMGSYDYGTPGRTLDMNKLHSIFGSPFLYLVPNESSFQFNLSQRMRFAKSVLNGDSI